MKFHDVYKTTPKIVLSNANDVFNQTETVLVNDGIFQIHARDNKYSEYVMRLFNKECCTVFGSDWIGRLFFVAENSKVIKIADGAFREIFDVPVNIQDFFDIEMVEFHKELLLSEMYKMFLNLHHLSPTYNQCAGYKVFPRLGGKDIVENLEIIDLDVYWGLLSQT